MRLFERSTGGAQLSANGKDFVVVAKRVLAELDGVKRYARRPKPAALADCTLDFTPHWQDRCAMLSLASFSGIQSSILVSLRTIARRSSLKSTAVQSISRWSSVSGPIAPTPHEPVVRTYHGSVLQNASACGARIYLLDRSKR